MKAQFQTLLRDVATARRTGSLSGSATLESANSTSTEPVNKVFSLLFSRGKLLGCEYAGRSGAAALVQLLDAQTVAKARWFPMRDDALANTEPLMPPEQLLFLMDGSSFDAPTIPASGSANSTGFDMLKRHAAEVFQEFFGDSAQDRVNRIFSGMGPTATSAELAGACSKALEPLLGEGMAQSYFKRFQ